MNNLEKKRTSTHTSWELKGKKQILEWANKNFHKLKEANKVKIWCKVYDKQVPLQIEGSIELKPMFYIPNKETKEVETNDPGNGTVRLVPPQDSRGLSSE